MEVGDYEQKDKYLKNLVENKKNSNENLGAEIQRYIYIWEVYVDIDCKVS